MFFRLKWFQGSSATRAHELDQLCCISTSINIIVQAPKALYSRGVLLSATTTMHQSRRWLQVLRTLSVTLLIVVSTAQFLHWAPSLGRVHGSGKGPGGLKSLIFSPEKICPDVADPFE